MIGLGTIVNATAIIVGSGIGFVIKASLPNKLKETVMQAIGLSVLFIGISGTLQGIFKIVNGKTIERQDIMLMIFSLVIGGIIGEIIQIEDKLNNFAQKLQSKFSTENSTFAKGFITATLVYCVGAMAIVGSLEDGLLHNPSTLFAKSILDGVTAIIFASTLGIGVGFSSISVFVYQGTITLLASFIKPVFTDMVIIQTSLVGSVLIFGIGLNLLDIKKIKVGNLLPSIFIPALYYFINILF